MMSDPSRDLAVDNGRNPSNNSGVSEDPEGYTSKQSQPKCTVKPRFNWKHRYLTSHGSAGSNGQVRIIEDFAFSVKIYSVFHQLDCVD